MELLAERVLKKTYMKKKKKKQERNVYEKKRVLVRRLQRSLYSFSETTSVTFKKLRLYSSLEKIKSRLLLFLTIFRSFGRKFITS